MPLNGGGTYIPAGADFPFVPSTLIESAKVNDLITDMGTAISTMIAKDGQTTVSANIPMAGFRLTGTGSGAAARTMSANTGDVQDGAALLIGTIGGTANAITGVLTPAITAYAAGQTFRFIPGAANTAATTININSVGAKNIFCDGAACVGAELASGKPVEIIYDGTQFHIIGLRLRRVPIMFSSGSQNIAGGSGTSFFGLAFANGTEAVVFFPAPFTGTLRNLRVASSGAAGVGETFTYTLRVSGSDTALTCQTTGAANTGSDTTNSAAVTAGAVMTMKLVVSAGAGTVYHAAAVELDF